MKLPEIFPPADLLEQVEGVTRGLRQRRRLGRLGWGGFLVASSIQIFILLANSEVGQTLQELVKKYHELDWPSLLKIVGPWGSYFLPAFAIIFFFVLANWARFWLKESKASFRYTCSVADFCKVPNGSNDPEPEWPWLSHDLKDRLNQRIRRLKFIDAALVKPTDDFESHVHLSGSYGIRNDRRDRLVVEVRPSVRIGPPGKPETLAHAVVVPLPATPDRTRTAPPPAAYDRILERVYFSLSSEIYRQIQRDVNEKIELLPTDHFRAIALFYEAEDYARSNTLDAYEEASRLYERSIKLLDPSLRPLPHFPVWRGTSRLIRSFRRGMLRIRYVLTHAFPQLGGAQVMCAQAEIGYATMLLYRRQLAGQSGQLLTTDFEARPVAERALKRLAMLAEDVPRRQAVLFDAHVVLAFALFSIGAVRDCEQQLAQAYRLDPNRTLENARYLFVQGLADHQLTSKVQTFRRVVELAPRFESAQFFLAASVEELWRTRPVFERNVAAIILEEYDTVSMINPGNQAAWANRGYVTWLLGDTEDLSCADDAFESGRESKAIRQATFVAELDFGQARIAAERGDFKTAFERYQSAVAAIVAIGHVSGSFESYYFGNLGETMLKRYSQYRQRVEEARVAWETFDEPTCKFQTWLDMLSVDDSEDSRRAACGLEQLLKVVEKRISDADLAMLKPVIEGHFAKYNLATAPGALSAVAGLAVLGDEATAEARIAAVDALRDGAVARIVRNVTDLAATPRVRNVVLAFVLNDYGRACTEHFNVTGDARSLDAASKAFERCIDELNPDYVMPYYNLLTLLKVRESYRHDPRRLLERIVELAPEWPEGCLAYAEYQADAAGHRARGAMEREASSARTKEEARLAALTQIPVFEKDAAHHGRELASGRDTTADKVTALDRKANELSRQSDDEKRRSDELTAAALRRLAALAPHAWLWQSMSDGRGRFRWSLLDDQDAAAELLWERECNHLHVRALSTLARLPSADETQRGAWRLLQHLRHHFSPDDFVMNRRLRDLLVDDVRALVTRAEMIDIFSDQVHQDLVDDAETRALLQRGALLRLAWKRPRARRLLFRPHFHRVRRSREYAVLLEFPEIRTLRRDEVATQLSFIAEKNVVRLLRGLDYDNLPKRAAYRTNIREGQRLPIFLRARLRRRRRGLQRLYDYAQFDNTIRWNIEHWLQDGRYPYWALTWLSDPSFASDEDPVLGKSDQRERGRRAILEHASKIRDRAPAFYYRVGQQLDAVPEGEVVAVEAYEKAIDTDDARSLYDLGMQLKSHNRLDASLKAFRRAFKKDENYEVYPEWQYRSAVATALWLQGSSDQAIGELREISTSADTWRGEVTDAMIEVIKTTQDATILRDWLESVRPRPSVAAHNGPALKDFHEAMLALAQSRPDEPTINRERIAVTTPVALEIDLGLVPERTGWETEHPLFKKYIPDMRGRIENDTGIRVPGIRIRGDEKAPAGSYTILLDEVPQVTGTVIGGAFFIPSSVRASIRSRGRPSLASAVDPLTGRPGEWVPAFDVTASMRPAPESWDPLQHIVYHIEAVLRRNLGAFFGVQELANKLETWESEQDRGEPDRSALVAKKIPDNAAQVQLLGVLQRLLCDRVPIRDLRTILDAFAAWPGPEQSQSSLTRIVEEIRLKLRASLPGNRPESLFIYLAPKFEAELVLRAIKVDGNSQLELAPAVKIAFFDALRKTIAANPELRHVVVTRQPGIRFALSGLIESELPQVFVLAFKELLPSLRRKVDAIVEPILMQS